MFCSACGTKLPDGSVACSACGTRLQPAAGGPAPIVGPVCTDPLARSKVVAGLLGIFLGGLGIHRFYLGYTTIGIIQIVVTLVTCGLGSLWGLVEGILIVAGATITTDAAGRPLRE